MLARFAAQGPSAVTAFHAAHPFKSVVDLPDIMFQVVYESVANNNLDFFRYAVERSRQAGTLDIVFGNQFVTSTGAQRRFTIADDMIWQSMASHNPSLFSNVVVADGVDDKGWNVLTTLGIWRRELYPGRLGALVRAAASASLDMLGEVLGFVAADDFHARCGGALPVLKITRDAAAAAAILNLPRTVLVDALMECARYDPKVAPVAVRCVNCDELRSVDILGRMGNIEDVHYCMERGFMRTMVENIKWRIMRGEDLPWDTLAADLVRSGCVVDLSPENNGPLVKLCMEQCAILTGLAVLEAFPGSKVELNDMSVLLWRAHRNDRTALAFIAHLSDNNLLSLSTPLPDVIAMSAGLPTPIFDDILPITPLTLVHVMRGIFSSDYISDSDKTARWRELCDGPLDPSYDCIGFMSHHIAPHEAVVHALQVGRARVTKDAITKNRRGSLHPVLIKALCDSEAPALWPRDISPIAGPNMTIDPAWKFHFPRIRAHRPTRD